MDVREKQTVVIRPEVEVRGYISIKNINPKMIEKYCLFIGEITPMTRLCIIE